MKGTDRDRTLALAGVFQAAGLVNQIATNGMADAQWLKTTLGTLFVRDPQDTADVFGGVDGVAYGLRRLGEQLGGQRANMQITQYGLGALILERKLSKDSTRMNALGEGLEGARRQEEAFGLTHDNTVAALAEVYSEVISPLRPQILVRGSEGHLERADSANRVRALLLAAIRCAVLWRQVGGSRWRLIFGRRKLINTAGELLRRTDPS
ncbi:high frequency lysogenization protein [Thiohalospira halophila DSM 15071]|uniref:High frequency lysogenization protein HflD homolog n=1 Tax=Thiohalospira halophila DSM 15071 TaxID=1123397 RepID=A0A1I1NZI8_9GAMM|nr:high frequency lysogenization protein HflD [Thiohalospira halophila]SFD03091.1 high frequency lysogenization protein [Thiohalospira halophila DSM 15071]